MEKLLVAQVGKTVPLFMKTDGSLLCAQKPLTATYPEPHECRPHFLVTFL
jgi:hypothetical protein